MNLVLKIKNNKVITGLVLSGAVVVGVMNLINIDVTMNVVDILEKAGIIAPSWIVTAITAAGSLAAIATLIGSLGTGAPLAVLEQLAAASTAAA
ncbi:hypothetical protein COI59_11670 [Bacillus toyonensis]|nr:hypothetical protein COI59_11670 [Bacillus toyonensis]